MDRFEGFAADKFPFRESFRTLRSTFVFGAFLQTDKDGLYWNEKGIGEFKRVDPSSVRKVAETIKTVAGAMNGDMNGDMNDDMNDVNVYYAFIPDKSIYSSKKLPGFDPILTEDLLVNNPGMDEYTFINLTGALDADSFYKTDIHWDQVKLKGVLDVLGAEMGFSADLSRYSEGFAAEFQGVYTGRLAMPFSSIGPDKLNYLANPSLNALYLDPAAFDMIAAPVYDWDKLSGLDAYDFFLSGAQPLIILENADCESDRELYLFRDSFSSSLAPLLAGAYARVILNDLRNIDMRTLNRFLEFKPGSDALFLYSSVILNSY
jgi:hypothetical protein